MKKLYEVRKLYYVMAETDFEAEFVDNSLNEPTIEVCEADFIERDWEDAIPAGSDNDKTCGQILRESKVS